VNFEFFAIDVAKQLTARDNLHVGSPSVFVKPQGLQLCWPVSCQWQML